MFAQTRSATSPGSAPSTPRLVPVGGFPFAVDASRGAREAASRIAGRARAAHDFLLQVLGVAPRLKLRVLDRADWLHHTDVDWYGTAHVASNGDLVVGSEPADEWQDVAAYLARRLPAREIDKLIAIHGADAASARRPSLTGVAEALIAHEVAHVLIAQQQLAFPSRWLEEAFANYVLVGVLGTSDPAGMRLIGSLAQAARALDADMPTLADFECGFAPMDAVWSVLGQLAITRAVYGAYARRDMKPLVDLLAIARASVEPDADHELGRMLRARLHPSIASIPDAFAVHGLGLAA